MKFRLLLIIKVFLAFLLLPGLSFAAPAPLNFYGEYHFGWNGLSFGSLIVDATEAKGSYAMTVDIKTTGLIAVFKKHKSHTETKGRIGAGHAMPQFYETRYGTEKKPKYVKLTYDTKGMLSETITQPIESPGTRPNVEKTQLASAIDILTAIWRIREETQKMLEHNSKKSDFLIYDGRRLARIELELAGRHKKSIGGKSFPIVEIIGRRIPVAGYTEKELIRIKDEPSATLYLSDDSHLLLLQVKIDLALGSFTSTLVKGCDSKASCLTP